MIIVSGLLWVVLFFVAIMMADERNRSIILCIATSIIFTPLVSIFILLVLGNSKS